MYPNMSHNTSRPSLRPPTSTCFRSEVSIYVFSAMSFCNLLLLPLFILVLYLGYQQWKKQRSISTTATSHSDVFTYHAIVMQLNHCMGFSFLFCGGYNELTKMTSVGQSILKVTSTGQVMFHILTCVERYLAVVHPITYMHLRQRGGVRTRNVSIGCVWLLSFGWLVVFYLGSPELNWILYFCTMAFDIVVVFFCSILVLYALKRPGPGEGGGNKERVNQSKQRAFYTILAIMGVLLFRFVGNLCGNLINNSAIVSSEDSCVAYMSIVWLDLPSSLVLPLLFLQRTGKLQCYKKNESG